MSLFGKTLGFAWSVLKKNLVAWAVLLLMFIIAAAAVGLFGYKSAPMVKATPGDFESYQSGEMTLDDLRMKAFEHAWNRNLEESETESEEYTMQNYQVGEPQGSRVVDVLYQIVALLLGVGATVMAINQVRGNKMNLWQGITSVSLMGYVRYVLAAIVMCVLIVLGLLLLIIPGVILSLMFAFVLYLIVDQKTGIFDSIALSNRITKGYKWDLLGYVMLSFVLNLLGLLALVLGLLVTIPLTYLIWAKLYTELLETYQETNGGDTGLDSDDIVLEEIEEGNTVETKE